MYFLLLLVLVLALVLAMRYFMCICFQVYVYMESLFAQYLSTDHTVTTDDNISVPDLKPFLLPIHYLEAKYKIPNTLHKDLELVNITSSIEPQEDEVRKSVYETVLNPSNKFGTKLIPKWSEYFTNDVLFLTDTQDVIKNVFNSQLKNVVTNNESEKLIETWNIFKRDPHFLETYSFIEWDRFSDFNRSSSFLQILSALHILSPVTSLLLPILLLLFPFILLKIQNIPISFSSYTTILQNIAKNHFIGKSIQSFSTFSFDKIFYFIVTFGLYILQIYQNFDACFKFKRNMERMHYSLNYMKQFINSSIKKMQCFIEITSECSSYKPFCSVIQQHIKELVSLEILLNDLPPLTNIFTQFSQNGYRLRCMYEIFENKQLEESLIYAMGFEGYLDNISQVGILLYSKVMNNAEYNKDITTIKNQIYPPHMDENPVSNNGTLEKNIIISSPNKSGKTTYLKAFTLNILFSQQFGCGFYDHASIYPYTHIHTYLNIPDTSGRDSLFQAESRRCKEMLDEIQDNPYETGNRHFCIFDELYSGTNPEEAIVAGQAFIDYLSRFSNVNFILTTHYFKICSNCKSRDRIQNYKMNVVVDDNGDFTYTYKIKKGISRIKGGIKVLKDLGYPQAILDSFKTL